MQKQKSLYLNLKTNSWTLISSSKYVRNDCIPLTLSDAWVFWLMINLTRVLIVINFVSKQMRDKSFLEKLRYHANKEITMQYFLPILLKGTLSGRREFLITESPLKMMKNAFYFTLKAIFVLKIFRFLSWLFGHVEKAGRLER